MSDGDSNEGAIMPPRGLRWLIVMFWLTTTGWLFWRDLWPSWQPGQPPPFHIDDVAEVHKGDLPRTIWIVQRGKVRETHLDKVFQAKTWLVRHNDGDSYSLHADLSTPKVPKLQPYYVADILKIEKMTSEYRVTRTGRLHSLDATVEATPDFVPRPGKFLSLLGSILSKHLAKGPPPPSSAPPVSLHIWGEVRDDQFFGHCRASLPGFPSKSIDLPPTAVSYTGSVLMPLHPINQISGLRPGQSWRQPLVDPLRDAFASLPGFSSGVRFLNGRVLPQAEMLQWGDSETSCLVIEYTDDENEMKGRTWVEQSSNRVLQQEAILDDSRWLMKRESPRPHSKGFPDE